MEGVFAKTVMAAGTNFAFFGGRKISLDDFKLNYPLGASNWLPIYNYVDGESVLDIIDIQITKSRSYIFMSRVCDM